MAEAGMSREALRRRMLAAFVDHHRRRGRRRQALLATALLAAAGAAWTLGGLPGAGERRQQVAAASAFSVQLVRGSPRSGLVRSIGDEELLQRLEEIGRPAGLVRIEGRTLLTDAAAAGPQPPPAL